MENYRGVQMKGFTYKVKEKSKEKYQNSNTVKVIRVYDAHTILVENENGKTFFMAKHNVILESGKQFV